MTHSVLYDLTEIFQEVFDDESIVPHAGLSAKDVDGWDSLTHIRLLLSVERRFKIAFSAAEVGQMKTVGDLIALIERKLNSHSS